MRIPLGLSTRRGPDNTVARRTLKLKAAMAANVNDRLCSLEELAERTSK
jgi:hypothetical protein